MTPQNMTSTPNRPGFAVALTLAALTIAGTAPALAATHHHRAVQSTRGLQMYAGESFDRGDDMMGDAHIDEARAAALHTCSVEASKYNFSTWQTTQFATFGTCMVEHGQQP
jgi:hypothetical protein